MGDEKLGATRAGAIVVVRPETGIAFRAGNVIVARPDDVRTFFLIRIDLSGSRLRTFATKRLRCVEVVTGIRRVGIGFFSAAGDILGLLALAPSFLFDAACACSSRVGFALHSLGFRLLLARALGFLSRSAFTPPGLLEAPVGFKAKLVGFGPLPVLELLAPLRQ